MGGAGGTMILRRTNAGPQRIPEEEIAQAGDVVAGTSANVCQSTAESISRQGCGLLGDQHVFEEVFKTLALSEKISSLVELNRLFRPTMHDLGFTLFAGIDLTTHSQEAEIQVLFGEGLEPWRTHCVHRGFTQENPVLRECLRTSEAF